MYILKRNNDVILHLLISTDDTLMTRSSKEEIHKLKKTLNGEFKMKDFSEVKMIIGMSILKSQKKKSDCYFLNIVT